MRVPAAASVVASSYRTLKCNSYACGFLLVPVASAVAAAVAWSPTPPLYERGVLDKYVRLVTSASEGAVIVA